MLEGIGGRPARIGVYTTCSSSPSGGIKDPQAIPLPLRRGAYAIRPNPGLTDVTIKYPNREMEEIE
jgi:hypothetical protein